MPRGKRQAAVGCSLFLLRFDYPAEEFDDDNEESQRHEEEIHHFAEEKAVGDPLPPMTIFHPRYLAHRGSGG